MTSCRIHLAVPALVVVNVSTLESATNAKMSGCKNAKVQNIEKKKLKLQKVQSALQKWLSINNSAMTSCKLMLLLLLLLLLLLITNHPILTMVKLVLKNQNTYLKIKMDFSINGVSDNDDFDLWTLGSSNEFQKWNSIPESVKKIIHKNKDVFCSKLTSARHIKSDPVKISIRGGRCQKPKLCFKARPIPAHWYAKGKSILADLEEQGLIIQVTDHSEFCSPCFFISKPHDPTQPRLVVDYSLINDIILCPVFPLASPEAVWRRVPKGKGRWWISNDLTSSYWQVRISEESQGITTFISEFGRFKWCVFPQGLSCSGDEFGQMLEIILSKYPKFTNFLHVVDDIAVYGESEGELEEQF